MDNQNIEELANTIMWWLSYITSVGRNYLLSEGAIRFPISEYLENLKKDNDKLTLEFPHPQFPQKRLDLCFQKYKAESDVFECTAFEFKYIKNGSTRSIEAKQNIFNDLMRLHFFLDENSKGYFLICGNQDKFRQDFQTLLLKPKNADESGFQSPRFKNNPIRNIQAEGFYTEWFSFDNENPIKIIDLTTDNSDYNKIYLNFINEYTKAYKNGEEKLILPSQISTNLVFISGDITQLNGSFLPSKIAIWEITKTT